MKGVSAYKAAKDTKIPQTMLYEWSEGVREPMSEYLVTLADFLGVSIDYLAGRTDKPEINK